MQTFVVAAQYENFHQTAETLYIAQPTVTQHIRQLERELGTELFVRTGKRVKLTSAGKRFLLHARSILEQWNEGVEDLVAWQQGYVETLQLAVSPIIAHTSLTHLIRRYTKAYPEVDISIQIADSKEIGQLVSSGQVDIGLTRSVPGDLPLATHLIQYDPIVFVVPPNGGDMEAPLPDWEQELSSRRLITYNHPGYWDELLYSLRQRDLSFRTMVVSRVDITKRFVEEGVGVSFLPRSAISRELFENRFIELATPGLQLPQVASYLVVPRRDPSQAAQRFIEILAALYPPLPLVT
ncbi:LysR family transcriptional regulator [Brevibacillus humidisoli]|nr:LysR family transcriptional regulator [Brevibacillus humidisoli]UFJ43424.1 LysR family transcriptional regulator [Brevibacillus humidisoli]